MKKFLAVAMCAVMLFALALPAMAFNTKLPVTPKSTIVVDGHRDDGYSESYYFNTWWEQGGTSGATGTVWTAWDDNYLYFYIEVNDTTPQNGHEWIWERDCVEIYVDWNSARGDENDNNGQPYWMIRIAPEPGIDGEQISYGGNYNPAEQDTGAIKYAVALLNGKDLKGGYAIEVALPVKEAPGASLGEGRTIIIDLQVSDNQDGSQRETIVFLPGNDERGEMWHKPSACAGVLTLGSAPTPPAPDPEPQPEPDVPADVPAAQEEAPAIPPTPASPPTGDGMIIFAVMTMAAAGVVVFKKQTSK